MILKIRIIICTQSKYTRHGLGYGHIFYLYCFDYFGLPQLYIIPFENRSYLILLSVLTLYIFAILCLCHHLTLGVI